MITPEKSAIRETAYITSSLGGIYIPMWSINQSKFEMIQRKAVRWTLSNTQLIVALQLSCSPLGGDPWNKEGPVRCSNVPTLQNNSWM